MSWISHIALLPPNDKRWTIGDNSHSKIICVIRVSRSFLRWNNICFRNYFFQSSVFCPFLCCCWARLTSPAYGSKCQNWTGDRSSQQLGWTGPLFYLLRYRYFGQQLVFFCFPFHLHALNKSSANDTQDERIFLSVAPQKKNAKIIFYLSPRCFHRVHFSLSRPSTASGWAKLRDGIKLSVTSSFCLFFCYLYLWRFAAFRNGDCFFELTSKEKPRC